MEWLSDILAMQFAAALAPIVMTDLVLASDSAILIVLAVRNPPLELQKKTIMWGTVGAIVVRTLMTLVAVWLLKIPGLMLVGGLALVWIAWKLLADDDQSGDEHGAGNTTLVGTMKTIIIADAVMGIDNVLVIVGVSHSSFLLVVLGLLTSVPVVVWGSGVVLRPIERSPVIIYGGTAVLAYMTAYMIVAEPVLKALFAAQPPFKRVVYAAVSLIMLGGGWPVQHHRQQSA